MAPFLVVAAILTSVAALASRLPGLAKRHSRRLTVFAFGCAGFALLGTVITAVAVSRHYALLRDAVENGDAKIVEGVVSDFEPMPGDYGVERFCVETQCFEYSDYVVTGGFNNSASHGGPIREGLRVRVTFVGPNIAKLEVGQ